MFTSLLALAALVPLQESPAAQDPATPAAPPVEAAVPAETAPSVRAFLVEAESHLYDPQAAGLSSVEFDVPIDVANMGVIGTAHVSWNSAGGANGLVGRPIAIVIDLAGNDHYASRDSFAQGSGLYGIGILIDAEPLRFFVDQRKHVDRIMCVVRTGGKEIHPSSDLTRSSFFGLGGPLTRDLPGTS